MNNRLQVPHPANKQQITLWVNEQIQQGVSRQSICDALLQDESLGLPLSEMEARMGVSDTLFAVMLNRNLDGINLEKQGQVKRAITLYEANLKDRFGGSHPYERLRIIYTKQQDYVSAIRVCQAFIDLPNSGHKRGEFQSHIDKLQLKQTVAQNKPTPKPKKQPKEPGAEAPIERFAEEQGIPVRWIEGKEATRKGRKTLVVSNAGNPATVEQYALEHYCEMGFQGSWSENNYWWAIMSLLFWDVLFAKLPGVYTPQFGEFPGPMQDMPLDLFSAEFYPRRQSLIEKRIKEIARPRIFGLVKPSISAELRTAHARNLNKPCRPMDWKRFLNVDELLHATVALNTEQIILIMRRLLENFNDNRKGLPDLFLIRENKAAFVEVKQPREQVAEHQFQWLHFLHDTVGVQVEICRVVTTT